MEINNKILTELQNRLKVGNKRGVHLNAIPANSRYKFDIKKLTYIEKELPQKFINSLLTEQPMRFKISWKNDVLDFDNKLEKFNSQLAKISKSFDNLINQTEVIESEKGISTFGFGFPLLVRKDEVDNKLTVAPILIWSLKVKHTKEFNTWVVQRNEDDPIYTNDVLINHLQNDSKIKIDEIPSEMLADGLIDENELIDICVNILSQVNSAVPETLSVNLRQQFHAGINPISSKDDYSKLPIRHDNAFIDFAGLFSIFEVQKQSIIADYANLMQTGNLFIDSNVTIENNHFQSISSVETDPSQQSILDSIKDTPSIIVQGPPGTGKSQTLTALLVNALENERKTMVVCEKRTALEVLENALIEKGLDTETILIKDIIRDRRLVVDSVRDRVDDSEFRAIAKKPSKTALNNITSQAQKIIDIINSKHKKLDEKLLDNNWSDTVGKLLNKLRQNKNANYQLNLDNSIFVLNSEEFNELYNMLVQAEPVYSLYKEFLNLSFLNTNKYIDDNPFGIEDNIKKAFQSYNEIFNSNNSEINNILISNKNNPDLFDDEKRNKFFYKMFAIISKQKKQSISDANRLEILLDNLVDKINTDNFTKEPVSKENNKQIVSQIQSILEKNKQFFENQNDVFTKEYNWYYLFNKLTDQQKAVVTSLLDKTNWGEVFSIYYFDTVLKKNANNNLPINNTDYTILNDALINIQNEQIKFVKKFWRAKQAKISKEFSQKHKDISVENLYNKRSGKNHKRLSLRKIVDFDIDLFTTFFPIILTTPDVSSAMFANRNKYFDIIMFDEASQLKIEDNLPALFKGKQIVVAGDEHQMPPSNYFSKVLEGNENTEEEENDDEKTLNSDDFLLSSESLLDFATEANFKTEYLDFHYRSKHPYLIDFSNYAFYNQRLIPLPNNFDYTPISYIAVDGIYQDHINKKEAEAVFTILEENIHRMPNGKYPSVGVATFNIAQRDYIKNKIVERKQFEKFKEFNDKMIELEESGFFVKNLENIQGDERDVIILSTTYGKDTNGKFAQRFGSINQQKGYKLLNVIVTRAKYKFYVCSSIPENVFLNYSDLLTEEGNNKKAVFYAYLAYSKAVSENNNEGRKAVLKALTEETNLDTNSSSNTKYNSNEFINEVYEELCEHFDKENVYSETKFAGFDIDIVVDLKIEGIPKIAIECDASANHNSEQAYVYDMHRLKILENYNFVFHRIWSTNWWRNPQKELQNLISFINKQENNSANSKYNNKVQNISNAFTNFGENNQEITETDYSEDIPKSATVNNNITEEKEEVKNVKHVMSNSIVTLKYLNNDNIYDFRITENSTEKNPNNGIQDIILDSPLAQTLLNAIVGDIVKIDNLDNYIEILSIN